MSKKKRLEKAIKNQLEYLNNRLGYCLIEVKNKDINQAIVMDYIAKLTAIKYTKNVIIGIFEGWLSLDFEIIIHEDYLRRIKDERLITDDIEGLRAIVKDEYNYYYCLNILKIIDKEV